MVNFTNNKCTIYCRVSSDRDEQANSINNQTSGLIDYAEQNNMIIADSGVFCRRNQESEPFRGYIDEGFSGAQSAKYRRAFQQMIFDSKMGLFKTILTKSVARFGRNVKDMLITIDELEKQGVGVWFEDIKAYSLNGADKIRIQLFATLAEEESRAKSDSIQWAKKQAARKGIWAGREPYGYNIEKGKLVVDEYEKNIVIMIFDLYLKKGYGVSKIAKVLEAELKVPGKRGGRWTGSHVAGILQNSVYTGHTTLHRTRKSNINLGLIEKIPESDQIKLDDESLRIITDETFELAEIERNKRPKMKDCEKGIDTRYSNAHLFSNLIYCSNCGGSMRKKVQKTTRTTHHYYYCRNHEIYGNDICKYRNLQREEDLLEWVKEEFRTFIADTDDHEFNFNLLLETKYESEDFDTLIKEAKTKLLEVENEKEVNFRLLSKQIIDDEDFGARNTAIKLEIEKLKSEINRYSNINKEIELFHTEYKNFIKSLSEINLDNLDNMTLRKFISGISIATMWIPGEGDEEQTIRSIHWRFMEWDQLDIINDHVKKFVLDKQPK
ncbi:hypothetical protein C1I60_12885 [Paenibacillus terrae]|uniref:Recombinase family protein n=1 Tax=Paenibacillus terrae TaxID=159743 RepID=A0A4U2PZK8_9BACL|nr:recombinase family protein [Paenibacillus terrae]TKH44220.1 hypothetical protein C1I60_12885 [Paenibacillus terrae]